MKTGVPDYVSIEFVSTFFHCYMGAYPYESRYRVFATKAKIYAAEVDVYWSVIFSRSNRIVFVLDVLWLYRGAVCITTNKDVCATAGNLNMPKVFYDDCTIAELEQEVADLSVEIDRLREVTKSFEACCKESSLPFIPALNLLGCIQKRDAVLELIKERQHPVQARLL